MTGPGNAMCFVQETEVNLPGISNRKTENINRSSKYYQMRLEDSFTEANKDTWYIGKTPAYELMFIPITYELVDGKPTGIPSGSQNNNAYYAASVPGRPTNYRPHTTSVATAGMYVTSYFKACVPFNHLSDIFMTNDTALYFSALG